jgi:hypothetical protein
MPRCVHGAQDPGASYLARTGQAECFIRQLLLLNRRNQSRHPDPFRRFARRIDSATHITGIGSNPRRRENRFKPVVGSNRHTRPILVTRTQNR